MIRVLHIIQATPFGGAQRTTLNLADCERRSGVDARMAILYHDPAYLRALQERAIPAICVTGRPCDPRGWARLRAGINRVNPDIIILHMALLWSSGVLAWGVGKKCPWVYLAHSYPPLLPSLKHRLTRRLLQRHLNAVIGVSRSVTQAMRPYFGPSPKIFRTIYNGIAAADLIDRPPARSPRQAGPAAGRPRIGMATRFAPDKGIREFIDLIPAMSRLLPEAHFVLAGDGPILPWARRYAAARGLTGRLELPGFIHDVSRFWRGLDLALFTAPREPFGLRIIEPQAAGVVVVGYQNGSGSDELIVPGETGVLVPWGDQETLARACAAVWADPAEYARLANAARRRLQTGFSLERASRGYRDLYGELLRKGRGG